MEKISLVIALAPNRNAEVVDSLKEVDYPQKNYEVIIEKGLSPSKNRNRGARRAKGKIVGFIDDDAVVDKKILIEVNDFFGKHPEVDIVGGPQLTPSDDRGFARVSGYALGSKFGAWKTARRYSINNSVLDADETMVTSANLFCRSSVLKKVKFDAKLFPGEDPKFISDAKRAGFRVAYSPEIMVYHRRRASARAMMKQMFSYGKTRTNKESFSETLTKRPFFLVPAIFIVYLALVFFASGFSATGAFIGAKNINFSSSLLLLPLIAYLVLDIGFSAYYSLKNDDYKALVILPFVYPMIHISYGAGILSGYLKNFREKK